MTNPIWHSLQNSFHDGVNWLQGKLTSGQQEALKLATSAAHYVEENGGKVLRDAASAAVIAAETVPGGGEAKFSAAVASVIATLAAKEIDVVKAAIDTAVQMAVADAKQAGLIN